MAVVAVQKILTLPPVAEDACATGMDPSVARPAMGEGTALRRSRTWGGSIKRLG
eukprot:CAMPEP_0170406418 /NCGR_PEP_ID=MMETSP0117_2-20130122/27702_1 /TAXON_ID=400756 /ORGANISM="Durinskia baltica, Strain CSIRO CS-38" /LENGTH=53 /DNA_ID=CAMNT_0010663595 /DNA_START=108 /DNA_END=267 /DNA_ORIENTATION=-